MTLFYLTFQTSQMEKELRDKVKDMDVTLKEVKVRKRVEVVEFAGHLGKKYFFDYYVHK